MKAHPVSENHGVININNDSGVVDGDLMLDLVAPHIAGKLKNRKALIVMDSAPTHLTSRVIEKVMLVGHVPVVVPAGMTMWLKCVDTHYAHLLKKTHEQTCMFGDAPQLTAKEARTSLAKTLSFSHDQVMNGLDLEAAFKSLGYIDPFPESISIRGMTEYTFQLNPEAEPQAHPARQPKRQRDIRDFFAQNAS